MYKKGVQDFLFCLDLELFAKIKRPGFYTLTETRLIYNSRSKQNKKDHEFWAYLLYGWSLFQQITWFLGNNRALSKFE